MIRVELAKQWRRPRTVLTLAVLALFTVVLTITLGASGAGRLERVGDIPLQIVPDRSGFSVPVIALASTMKFFLPLAVAVAVFAGESVAGEAAWGSLRYALAGPVSRSRYLLSKLFVALLFSRALDNIPGLHALSPWLPVTDSGTTLWTGFFTRPMQTPGIAHVLEVQAGYTAAFLAVALVQFAHTDVLS